jgi:hypothetical protein
MNQSLSFSIFDPGFQAPLQFLIQEIVSDSYSQLLERNSSWLENQTIFAPLLLLIGFYSVIFFIGLVIWRTYGRTSWKVLNHMENLLEELSNTDSETKWNNQKEYYLKINLLANRFRIQAYQNLLENN